MEQFCRSIGLPEDVTREVLAWQDVLDDPQVLSPLTREETWETGLKALARYLEPDPRGIKQLYCMLRCALAARETYQKLGLSDQIYHDTMGCFPRFVNEHTESFGRAGFDRGFWTVRQVSCKLFRIGQLEYELVIRDGQPMLSLHIPSDAVLKEPLLRESYLQARRVIGEAFPLYADAPVYCSSWLLSPTLGELLPPRSNILTFQRSFTITAFPSASRSYLQWIVKNSGLAPEDFPEDTSLQRNLKAFLLSGGSFLMGKGFLAEEPFLTGEAGGPPIT